MHKLTLGRGLEVSAIGLGCMSMTGRNDARANIPRFEPETVAQNQALLDAVGGISSRPNP